MTISRPTQDRRLNLQADPGKGIVMRQRWSGLLFLHWPMDPSIIQKRLPAGLYVDTFEETAWVGVIPFFMEALRPRGFPAVPWLSWFLELNVRTYVHDAQGNPGVWFFSLDCNQPIAVEIARRVFHLPYQHAKMKSITTGQRVHYRCCRRTSNAVEACYEYNLPDTTNEAKPGSLEWFLVERYLLFSTTPAGQLYCGRVHHRPYRIAPGKCDLWSSEPLRLNGFAEPLESPSSILTASSVDVKVFPLRKLKSSVEVSP